MKKTEKTRTHFTYRIDTWIKPEGKNILEHVAGVEITSLRSPLSSQPANAGLMRPITLRQGARVIEDSRRLRLAWSDKGRRGGR